MKFMVILKATSDSEAGTMPTPEQIEATTRFNEGLAKDGLLLAAEGLWPSSKDAARVCFDPKRTTVTDGPFAETKELVGGYWMVQATSREEVVERFKHAPFSRGETIEIRRVIAAEDFSEFATPEMIERWEKV
jgi:hypothetical protein